MCTHCVDVLQLLFKTHPNYSGSLNSMAEISCFLTKNYKKPYLYADAGLTIENCCMVRSATTLTV